MYILISYDIPNDKRRLKVMKALLDYGTRVQYSVFECELNGAQALKLRTRLKGLIEPKEDDVRFYFLCDHCVERRLLLGHPKPERLWEKRESIFG